MRRFKSFKSNVVVAMVPSVAPYAGSYPRQPPVAVSDFAATLVHARQRADGREVPSSTQNVLDRAMLADREHDDRHTVFLSKRERGGVHDLQAAIHGFLMVKALKALGLGIMFRIRSIHAIDIGGLENGV